MNIQDDSRNVTDEFKGLDHDSIVSRLDTRGVRLEIAIENLERDFNMGTIVRSANAFGVRTVHIIGSRQWNKRGAMATDKYLTVCYHLTVLDFVKHMESKNLKIIAVDNVEGSLPLHTVQLPENTVLVFGSEAAGISETLLRQSAQIVAIEQLGSTRSLNVGVAAGVVMYHWLHQRASGV